MNRYAISDIHGCAKTFRYLTEEILQLKPDDQLFLLGDYIDRGPDTKGIIDYILALKAKGYTIRTLAGNHEYMLLQARTDEEYYNRWFNNGGAEALASFQVATIHDIPANYWQFFTQLEYYIALDDYLLVHAGFNFTAEKPFEDTYSMLWIRNFSVDETLLDNRKIVHGHTPTPFTKIKQDLLNPETKVINIDGGCVYKHQPKLGHLTALNLDTLTLHFVPNQE